MERKVSIAEIEDKDALLEDITKGLPMSSGSLMRLAEQNIVKLLGAEPEDWDEVERRSKDSYFGEFTDQRVFLAIETAIRNAELVGNSALNEILALNVVGAVLDMHRKYGFSKQNKCNLCDVGGGNGETTRAILQYMNMSTETRGVARYCKFHVNDPSERIREAERKIRSTPLNLQKSRNYFIDEDTFEESFLRTCNNFYHIVYSTAVFHHFTRPTYLPLINQKMKDDGYFVSADWFTHVWGHPAYIIAILQELGASNSKINRFRTEFNAGAKTWVDINSRLKSVDEQQANREMIDFVVKLGREMGKLPEDIRLPFFEAHETLSERLEKMKHSNFDIDDLKKTHRSRIIQVFPKSSIGQVIIAKKKRLPS
jgi:SAM-dependent methyltransferase